jgi:hypothetical protein
LSQEYTRLNNFRTNHASRVEGADDALVTALTGYVASVPTIVQAMNTVLANYTQDEVVQETDVSTAHREALATVIEAELA